MNKTYRLPDGASLIIADSALSTFARHIQLNQDQAEAGGVLLGRFLLESEDIVIDEATEPQQADNRSRFLFFRSSSHDTIAKERWRISGQKIAYLGLWHSHPELNPSPSETDLKDWRKALAKDKFDGEYLFFVILGQVELGLWIGNTNGEITKLREEHDQNQIP